MPDKCADTPEPENVVLSGGSVVVENVQILSNETQPVAPVEAPLRSADGSSGRIIELGGSAVAPADDAASSRVALGTSSTGPATVLIPAPGAEEIVVPELEESGVVTTEPVAEEILIPDIEEDEVVTPQPVPAPVEEEIGVPELEEDGVVTTQPVLPADEQP